MVGVARELIKIKNQWKVTKEIKWKYFGHANDSKGRNAVSHLSFDERNKFREAIFGLITGRKSIKVIACVSSCEALYNSGDVKCSNDIYEATFKPMTERFQYFLQDISKEIGSHQYGMIISDHRMNSDDQRLRRYHHTLMDKTSKTSSNYSNIIETIQFAPSDFSVGLQLADMVAGAVGRYYQHQDKRFVRLLKSAFRTSRENVIAGYGLVTIPKNSFIEPSGGEA